MEGGLLSLKWNNHRSTFFHVLSTVRKKGSYCDVTIACDGKFYQVHKIVLATCSDYFEQIFERTNPVCKTPVIVLKDIRHEDLEALLNYMYLGEVNVLQTDLSGLIKAAECLRIKGLAVPDEAPNEQEAFHDNKRNLGRSSDEPDTKRFRSEIPSLSQRLSSATSDKSVREREPLRPQISYREPFREPTRVRETLTLPSSPSSSPASQSTEPHLSNSGARESSPDVPTIKEPSSAQETHSRGTLHSNVNTSETPERELIVDENVVKEEPLDEYSEADETKDSIRSVDSDPGLNYPHQSGDHSSGSVTGDSESTGFIRTSQPQTMEDLVAQVIPGTSGLQGNSWEGDRNLLGMPFEGYSGSQVRGPQMVSACSPRNSLPISHPTPQYSQSRRVSADKPKIHGCTFCPKVFNCRKKLEAHLRTHTGEKPFACQFCPYRSAQKGNLQLHIRTHTGEEPFTCTHCSYKTKNQSNLNTHIRAKHITFSGSSIENSNENYSF